MNISEVWAVKYPKNVQKNSGILKNLIFLKLFGVLGIFRIIKKISGIYRNSSGVSEENFREIFRKSEEL
jgi:hypothetical protein